MSTTKMILLGVLVFAVAVGVPLYVHYRGPIFTDDERVEFLLVLIMIQMYLGRGSK